MAGAMCINVVGSLRDGARWRRWWAQRHNRAMRQQCFIPTSRKHSLSLLVSPARTSRQRQTSSSRQAAGKQQASSNQRLPPWKNNQIYFLKINAIKKWTFSSRTAPKQWNRSNTKSCGDAKLELFPGARPPDTTFASWYDLTLALVSSISPSSINGHKLTYVQQNQKLGWFPCYFYWWKSATFGLVISVFLRWTIFSDHYIYICIYIYIWRTINKPIGIPGS